MGIIAAGQITVVDLSDAPVLNTFITASRPTTQTYSKDSGTYNPSYASTPQVLTLKLTKAGSTANIIDSISSLHWFVVDGPVKTEIASKDNTANEYISGAHNEILTTKLDININKGSKRYEVMGIWPDPSTGLDVQFGGYIDLLLTQNGATGPQGPQGDKGDTGETGNGIANTVITYGLSMSDTTEPATWSSDRPALVKGMYLWTRTVIIYTNGESTTSYQISYIPKDGDATGEIDKTKQELLEKLDTVRNDSLAAVGEAKEQLETVRNDSLAAVGEAKEQLTTVANDLSKAKTDFQNAVNTVDTKATNIQNDLSKAKQDLASQTQQLQEQANAQSELTNRVSSVEKTANGTKTTVSELSKTVDQNGKDITSVTARTKVVEDDLSGTKTTLSQVKTTADNTSKKTATLETGLNGLAAKFNSLSVGGANLFKGSRDFSGTDWINNNNGIYAEDYKGVKIYKTQSPWNGRSQYFEVKAGEEYVFSAYVKSSAGTDRVTFYLFHESKQPTASGLVSYGSGSNQDNITFDLTNKYKRIVIKIKITKDGWIAPRIERYNSDNYLYFGGYKLERGNIATDYSPNEADLEQKVAEYKQNADQNYASLQTTVQNLDGTVQHNKTTAEQTAAGFKTRIESLETYKSGESTRANQYFESAKTETARQLTAERTAIAKDYVAKSTYISDVTGIRNDLTATTTTANTTKTNLANYQASNDKMVASLKSSLQTTDGNVSNLQTKVEAVPGQITSAVSAVEGKIPTSAGGRNLALGTSAEYNTGKTSFSGINNDTVVIYRIYNRGLKVGDKVNVRLVLKYSDIVVVEGKTARIIPQAEGNVTHWGRGGLDVGRAIFPSGEDDEVVLTAVTTITEDYLKNDYWNWQLRIDYVSSGCIRWKEAKAEAGDLPTPWSPAPEDTATQISNLSSRIQQTADGMTLLATKTELNSAKTELQSGINTATNKANSAQSTANSNAQTISTHTTQISALNTGLSAKVSQSDFNTLSGRVTTAENNITAKANELSSKISSVEGKIPTSVGGRNLWIQSKATGGFVEETLPDNHVTGQKKCYRINSGAEMLFNIEPNFSSRLYRKVTFSAWIKYDNVVQGANSWNKFNVFKHNFTYHNSKTGASSGVDYLTLVDYSGTSDWKYVHFTVDYSARTEYDQLKGSLFFNLEGTKSGTAWVTGVKVEIGSIPSDYTPAPEDTAEQISNLSSQIKQTADGMTLLATKTELNTAKTELQSGINTATNKANSNAQTISTHTTQISALNTGLSAKVSQSDFNTLSGRVTTAENNITAKANELSSKITSVEGKIPTEIGAVNLFKGSRDFSGTDWINNNNGIYAEDYKGVKIYKTQSPWNGRSQYFEVKAGEEYVFSAYVKSSAGTDRVTFYLFHESKQPTASGLVSYGSGSNQDNITFDLTNKYKRIVIKIKITKDGWIAPRIERYNSDNYLYFGGYKLERGDVATDWSPAPEDTISQISSLSSEIKQTTDAIKASVTSLDNSTVKNSSLTINADGIVMKAGKSTTDVANAIGSYFAVNQNAINLFSDKINVKGHMIVSGSISSDKIASSGITANVIKGGTLQSLNGSTNFELDTGKLFYNNNNTGVFRIQNGASTMGLKFSNTSVTVNGTSRILSRVILGGDRRETTLDDGKWDQGGFTGIVAETINGVDSNTHSQADTLRVIGDNIYFTHSYNYDTQTKTSAQGWKMETFSPFSSYPGNVVLKPYGVNYRQSDIITGDIRLDNGDGSGYWVRDCIKTLKRCFQHYLNGGTTSGAMNAIRDTLNDISGV